MARSSVPKVDVDRGDSALAAAAQPVPEEAPEEERADSGDVIRFIDAQHFEIRTITEADWKKAGIESGRTVHWYKGNRFMVPVADLDFLTREQLEILVLADPRFEVSKAD